jgi:hypothetical protein
MANSVLESGNTGSRSVRGLLPVASPWPFFARSSEVADSVAKSLPHLQHVYEQSRTQASWITVYDYDADWLPIKNAVMVHVDFANQDREGAIHDFLQSLRHHIGNGCKNRTLIVEDLCSNLALALSLAFDLSPEVCEDHLVNSGWTGTYADFESDGWNTRRVEKEHVTLKWYRPGTLNLETLEEEVLELSRNEVLNTTRTEFKLVREPGKRMRRKAINHNVLAGTNIWRRHLDFRADKDGPREEGDPLAWEERVTIWQRYEEDCNFGMKKSQALWTSC